jgi:transposase
LKAHRSGLLQNYLGSLAEHIQMAFLPPYTSTLNPLEYLWAWLKRHVQANYCPNGRPEPYVSAQRELRNAQQRPSIIAACWKQATLW